MRIHNAAILHPPVLAGKSRPMQALANPTRFLAIQRTVQPWLWAATGALFATGLYTALFMALHLLAIRTEIMARRTRQIEIAAAVRA
jgi:ABC-type transport system involved in cytochrome c biogenesis permease subunit